MSGPTYPPVSNGEPFDIWSTVISQYANSPILTQLIQNLQTYFDPTTAFDLFYNNIWNIDSAVGAGLDVWGRILDVRRVLNLPISTYFGFAEAQPDSGEDTYGFAPFYSGQQLTQNFSLTDDAYRNLLLAKATANICDGSIPSYNKLLMALFNGRGNCFVTEGSGNGTTLGPMSIAYVFEFPLNPVDLAIIQQSGVLPKPSGVSAAVFANPLAEFIPLGYGGMQTASGAAFLVRA